MTEDLIWTGNWPDAVAFMDRVGYAVPFLGTPALILAPCEDGEVRMHVASTFKETVEHCDVGDRIRWYPSTKSFSVIKSP